MSEIKKRKTGGGKLTRSITVTIRMDPKMRYLTEIAARCQRRTVSSFIEWAIENSLKSVELGLMGPLFGEEMVYVSQESDYLWHVHESSRFFNLALKFPTLLTHREQVLWQLIRDSGLVRNVFLDEGDVGEWNLDRRHLEDFVYPALREHWDQFNAVADGHQPEDDLPNWK